MFNSLVNFFKTGCDRPLISKNQRKIKKIYERKRLTVFLSVTFGYGLFYICRINFSVVKKPLLDAGILTPTQMGIVGSGLLFIYSFGKLTNGFLADRSNIRRFMSIALLLSAVVNLLLGFNKSFVVFLVLWTLNGWFQSIGSAPSVVSLSHWFGRSELGTRYGLWSASHSIGEAITFAGTTVLVSLLGWRWGFIGPGFLCVIASLVLLRTLADRPQTYGLPSISKYKGEPELHSQTSIGKHQMEVIKNPGVWLLALASGCMYIARYGIGNWGPLYLQLGKGYSATIAGSMLAVYPITEIVGSVTSGYISDRFFRASRNIPASLYAVFVIISLLALYFVPPGNKLLDITALALFGFSLGGILVFLGGLMAVDIVSRKAVGAAMGLVGLFSYLVAAIQDTVSGYLIDSSKTVINGTTVYSFKLVFTVWIGAMILSTMLTASIWIFGFNNPNRRRRKDTIAEKVQEQVIVADMQ